MADFSNITKLEDALAAVPAARAFTNPDGTPAFRLMLVHMRAEADCWRHNRRVGGRPDWRKLGGYALRTIAESLRHLAAKEAARLATHPLRKAANAVDAVIAKHGVNFNNHSRAFAILAFAAGRPAVVTLCMYGTALTDTINAGEASPEALAASPLDLKGVVALNAAGERFVAKARVIALGATAAPLALAA